MGILKTVWWDFSISALTFTISECMTAGYNYMLIFLIGFLKDKEATNQEGYLLVAAFISAIVVSGVLRNYYIYSGYFMAVKVRKTFISAIYDKVAALSMRSLTETNSGKLITMISSDINIIERGLTFGPLIVAAPFVALLSIYLVKVITNSWEDAAIVGVLWSLTCIFSMLTSACAKQKRALDAFYSDGRMKLINDMVIGARTIKSYGWENHFFNKIKT